MNQSEPYVTVNELKLQQREIKVMFAAQERKLDAYYETLTGAVSDLAENVRKLSVINAQIERRLSAIENLLISRRTD